MERVVEAVRSRARVCVGNSKKRTNRNFKGNSKKKNKYTTLILPTQIHTLLNLRIIVESIYKKVLILSLDI